MLVFAEMPGITPKVLDFADRVAGIGCTAVVPHLFGVPGAEPSIGKTIKAIGPACVSKEFSAWATGRTSPVIEWCKALARQEHERHGGPGVGVVGMCFTGNFALAMLPEPAVQAPVLSQPSLPLGFTKKARRGLYLSEDDLGKVQDRMAAEPDLCLLGLRFTGDRLVPEGPLRAPPGGARRSLRRRGDRLVEGQPARASLRRPLGAHRAPHRRARPADPRRARAGARPLPDAPPQRGLGGLLVTHRSRRGPRRPGPGPPGPRCPAARRCRWPRGRRGAPGGASRGLRGPGGR